MSRPGDIVLFRFPQTDLTKGKLRPALLIQALPGPYDAWLISMISSQTHQYIEGFDEIVGIEDMDFSVSGLKQTSVIRIGRLAVVQHDMLAGGIGHIAPERLQRLRKNLARWLTRNN